MATYNGEKYIREQIDSILTQLSDEDELIISDDASNDRTLDIIAEYNDKRIKVLHHIPAIGNSFVKAKANFENALICAKGDYIFLTDQDDVWKPNKVLVMVSALSDCLCVQSELEVIGNIESNYKLRSSRSTLIGNIIYLPHHGCCMAFRKELLDIALPFPKNVPTHDAWIGCLAFSTHSYRRIPDKLLSYRIHANNVAAARKSTNSVCYKIYYRLLILWHILRRKYNI